MGVKVGLDREQVVAAAAGAARGRSRRGAADADRAADRLGVRTQSLYAHVDGADGLRRELALYALARLTDRLRTAAIGVAGRDAISAIVHAYVTFATEHPGLYAASMRAPGDDPELRAAIADAMEPLDLVFRSYGLEPTERSHWYRMVFSCVYGFAALRARRTDDDAGRPRRDPRAYRPGVQRPAGARAGTRQEDEVDAWRR